MSRKISKLSSEYQREIAGSYLKGIYEERKRVLEICERRAAEWEGKSYGSMRECAEHIAVEVAKGGKPQ